MMVMSEVIWQKSSTRWLVACSFGRMRSRSSNFPEARYRSCLRRISSSLLSPSHLCCTALIRGPIIWLETAACLRSTLFLPSAASCKNLTSSPPVMPSDAKAAHYFLISASRAAATRFEGEVLSVDIQLQATESLSTSANPGSSTHPLNYCF